MQNQSTIQAGERTQVTFGIYYSESRNRFVVEDDCGNELDPLPTKIIVCPRCGGKGKHDHPAFRNGLTQSDFDEDPDFREDYFRGRYDVECGDCHGNNVVAIPDEDAMSPELQKALHQSYREERQYRAEIEAERRMGC